MEIQSQNNNFFLVGSDVESNYRDKLTDDYPTPQKISLNK